MLLLVILQSLPSLKVPLSWDLSTLLLPLNFRFHLNQKEGPLLLMLLQYLPPLNFRYRLHYNLKEELILPVLLKYLPPMAVSIS